jgi:hypothetical protein
MPGKNFSHLPAVSTAFLTDTLAVVQDGSTQKETLQQVLTLLQANFSAMQANSLTFLTTAGIVGTTTNTLAASGSVGEVDSNLVPSTSPVSLTTATVTDIASVLLAAGDYDVWGNGYFSTSANVLTSIAAWISTTSAVLPDASYRVALNNLASPFGDTGLVVPMITLQLAAPATVYLSVSATFSAGTVSGCGNLYVRRRR